VSAAVVVLVCWGAGTAVVLVAGLAYAALLSLATWTDIVRGWRS
jgi:hypothetical protein